MARKTITLNTFRYVHHIEAAMAAAMMNRPAERVAHAADLLPTSEPRQRLPHVRVFTATRAQAQRLAVA